MAAEGGLSFGAPPDKSLEKVYKCYPKQKVTTLVCIVCESAYHRRDYEKLKHQRYTKVNCLCYVPTTWS